MRFLKIFLCLLFVNIVASAQITSPAEFLGYELGEKFTRHHQVVDYFKQLESEASDKMKIVEYGKTNEGRPLFTAILSSPENMQRLEEIRTNNLKRVGLEDGDASELGIAIVWLSYNVHGDEPVSTEAALKTIHKLLDPSDAESAEWLKKTVIIMDPCINPDGRARYVQFYSQFRQQPVNPHPEAFSHNQQWPRGRSNHYFFDLNRDWVWQTQIETKQRLKIYHEWMPHIHVDFHEQGFNSPYYFAPAAEPYHEVITDWQRNFQIEIGKNHAKYFDRNYWSYFSAEVFDLLYPSYGDTYPTFNGAIGMTYEQGGSAQGGTAVITEYGDTLTLADRIEHHYTTGFSTVEIAANRSDALEKEFEEYFSSAPAGPYKAYMISGKNDPAKISKLTELLRAHYISYGVRNSDKSLKGIPFSGGASSDISLSDGDLVIPVNQPKARLITALFEPETYVFDSVTYDLTAWNLPLAYGLEGAALTTVPAHDTSAQPEAAISEISGTDYGYLLDYTSLADGKALAYLLDRGVQAGVAEGSFEMNGKKYPIGTVVILKGNNRKKDLGVLLSNAQRAFSIQFMPVSTGYTAKGIDLGSNKVRKLKANRIGLIAGAGTSSYNAGELWYFLEQELKYPMTMIKASTLNYVDLSDYDVLIMPNGGYSGLSSQVSNVKKWVRDGGKVIAIGNAIRQFADEEGSGLTLKEDENTEAESDEFESVGTFGNRQREYASESIPGAIFEINLDNTHPLGYGYAQSYFTLKTSSFGPVRLTNGNVVGQMPDTISPVNGFAGSNAMDKLGGSVVIGKSRFGSGSVVVFTDNPVFRAFWENGKLLVVNALLMDR